MALRMMPVENIRVPRYGDGASLLFACDLVHNVRFLNADEVMFDLRAASAEEVPALLLWAREYDANSGSELRSDVERAVEHGFWVE